MSDTDNLPVAGSENLSEFLMYQSDDGNVRIQLKMYDGSVWLTQRMIAELYQKSVSTINKHILDIFDEMELPPEKTIRSFRIVQSEGNRKVSRVVDFYNLDVIISVGYRARSDAGTRFRQWATKLLKEYMIKGFILDDERLKEGDGVGKDYFEELLWRIRDIRASERRFYQKITDIYATSIDYDAKAQITKEFYMEVQNKLHWAIHGHTAAEIVYSRSDSSKPNMGLNTWKAGPDGKIHKSDISIAKNYLSEEELKALNLIVTQYLDFAESQALQRKPMRMEDWIKKLDGFIQLNDREILRSKGKISAERARKKAETEFEIFERERRIREASEPISDFDMLVEKTQSFSEKRD